MNNFYDWSYAPENMYFRRLDYSLDFYGTLVPEPSTWALLTLGGAAWLMRRKARKPKTEPERSSSTTKNAENTKSSRPFP